jgi:hypothetical protein
VVIVAKDGMPDLKKKMPWRPKISDTRALTLRCRLSLKEMHDKRNHREQQQDVD